MGADGADLWRFGTDVDVSAIEALPDDDLVALEDDAVVDVGDECEISLFVLFLDRRNAFEHRRDLVKALFARLFGEGRVHVRPLVVFALCGVDQVGLGVADAAVEQLEPHLCVFLFVVCGLLEDVRDLDVAVLFRLGSVVGVLVARLRLAGKGGHQIFLGFRAFDVHNVSSVMSATAVFLLYPHNVSSVMSATAVFLLYPKCAAVSILNLTNARTYVFCTQMSEIVRKSCILYSNIVSKSCKL